jgi:tyrosyl-tRNA synthetase
MTKDSDLLDLLTRGVEEVIDKKNLERRLASGDKLRIKLGIDPTSPNIHIGRAVVLWKLRALQDLGHQVIFIVGDFTGLIGDTSDKDSERPMLTEEQVKANMQTYLNQAFKILDAKKTETHYNSEWLKELGFMEISKMANLFGLHEFESREVISKRMKAGKRVSLRELMYPLMQAYDSVAVKADVELGGTDQRFNLLAGRTIQPLYSQVSQDIIMMDLLEGTDGRKMSSSWGNVINITDEPNNMFGKVMSIGDNLILRYFKLATKVPLEEIKVFKKQLEDGANPRDIKISLAEELTALYHSKKDAEKAKEEFKKVFSKKELPEDILEVENKDNILTTIVAAGIVSSNSEGKRLMKQKAVKVNDEIVEEWEYKLKSGDIVKIGPRRFSKIK